ncbi:alpha/beta hydrolase [Thioflexithrix psekupsensis]|uniref:Serine aminopeptidase S33 domain-containing protein n=1 Tax=Thioflexithrix psekupsensis TaxID=1570016 RepID=A0A251XBM4_9GAMM|nr:alpha/beta fold hydrolase [Thioflexithrix psekupsensis]OUD15490.1 hypothetical protein TPSD3_02920 [Thioflexithrix psekupsensis]
MMKFYSVFFALFLMVFNLPVYAESVQIKHHDVMLNGVLTLAKGKSLANESLIVMVHGTLGHAQMDTLSTLQATLNDHDFNVLSINLSLGQNDRALQLYPCEQTHTHRHTDALEEINAWLQWAKAQNAGNIVLLGHSRGGNQAAWFVSQNEVPQVTALVLLAPMTRVNVTLTETQQALLTKAKQLVNDDKANELLSKIAFLYCPETQATAATFVSYYEPVPEMHTPYLLPSIKIPTLVISGSEDNISVNLANEMAALTAQFSHIVHHDIMGADHFFRDLYADDVVEIMNGFLNR